MLQETILRLSNDFLREAKNSPTLLNDMAAMEKYMSESYSNRILIELLQNADDAQSTEVLIAQKGDSIIFANNGRPFDENDVTAISRSGSSSKKRGETIGYRGIGFKSTSFLSKDIIIFSNDTTFTFSKSKTAFCLNTSEENVPTIRIPFLIEDNKYDGIISEVKRMGYDTIFIFTLANPDIIKGELGLLSPEFLLFLRNVQAIRLEFRQEKKSFSVTRNSHSWGKELVTDTSSWAIISGNLAFSLKSGIIEKCGIEQSTYYCFLPTYDKVLYPLKVNADFSTDPSRKHIILDDRTKNSLDYTAHSIVELIMRAFRNPISLYKNVLTILTDNISFSQSNIYLKSKIAEFLSQEPVLVDSKGRDMMIADYKLFDEDYEEGVVGMIRKDSSYVKEKSLMPSVYNNIDGVDKFIALYSDERYSIADLVGILSDVAFVNKSSDYLCSYLLGKLVQGYQRERYLSNENINMTDVYVKTDKGVLQIKESNCEEIRYILSLNDSNQIVTESVLMNFMTGLGMPYVKLSAPTLTEKEDEQYSWQSQENDYVQYNGYMNNDNYDVTPSFQSWRSAETVCVEIERRMGNDAVDVSGQYLGYDVESVTPSRRYRYICVKKISKSDLTFTLTNNEYIVASQYGDDYFICLIYQDGSNSKAIYIKNPVNTLQFEKRFKDWDWYCERYNGVEVKINY